MFGSELKHTVETHPNLFEVHFDADGNHYFNVWKHLPTGEDVLFGKFVNGSPILSSRIVKTATREEVLGLKKNFDTTDKADFVTDAVNAKEASQTGAEPVKKKRK